MLYRYSDILGVIICEEEHRRGGSSEQLLVESDILLSFFETERLYFEWLIVRINLQYNEFETVYAITEPVNFNWHQLMKDFGFQIECKNYPFCAIRFHNKIKQSCHYLKR